MNVKRGVGVVTEIFSWNFLIFSHYNVSIMHDMYTYDVYFVQMSDSFLNKKDFLSRR